MQNEPKYSLVEFSKDEIVSVTKRIEEVLKEYTAQFAVSPVINPNGTIGAKLEIFKRVELVPKGGIPSPFIANGEPDTKGTEAEKVE